MIVYSLLKCLTSDVDDVKMTFNTYRNCNHCTTGWMFIFVSGNASAQPRPCLWGDPSQHRSRLVSEWDILELKFFIVSIEAGPHFYIRAPRATGAQRPSPAGSECTAIALDMGQAHLWFENNTMQTIHAIQTLRTVCGFLDMGDGCCLIFNKNQLMFIVRKSITAQIKKKIILFFS